MDLAVILRIWYVGSKQQGMHMKMQSLHAKDIEYHIRYVHILSCMINTRSTNMQAAGHEYVPFQFRSGK